MSNTEITQAIKDLKDGLNSKFTPEQFKPRMEAKIKEVEVQVVKENVRIETKYVDKVRTVKEKGDEIIRYVDREIVKFDDTCKLPNEFILIFF